MTKLYEYEVLYYKRSNKVHKSKGLSRFDGILSIHSSPSYLVTLKSMNDEHTSANTTTTATNNNNTTITNAVATNDGNCEKGHDGNDIVEEDGSNSDDDDDDEGAGGLVTSRNRKQSYKAKMKRMRKRYQKRKSKKVSLSSSLSSTTATEIITTAAAATTDNVIYSSKNINVAKATFAKPNGLDADDIAICGLWECQIIRRCVPWSSSSLSSSSSSQSLHRAASSNNNSLNTISTATKNVKGKAQSRISTTATAINTNINTITTKRQPLMHLVDNTKKVAKRPLLKKSTNRTKAIGTFGSNNNTLPLKRRKISPLQSMHKIGNTNRVKHVVHGSSSNNNSSTNMVNNYDRLMMNRIPPKQPTHMTQIKDLSDDDNNNDDGDGDSEEDCNKQQIKKKTPLLSSSKKRKLIPTSIHRSRSISLSKQSLSTIPATIATSSSLSSTQNSFFPGAIGEIQVPQSIKSILRPHQIEGITFLWNCITSSQEDKNNAGVILRNGAVLADEMGLGKTLMTITVLLALYRKNRRDRFVIVCPSSLVNNWSKEFDKWIGKASQPKRVVIHKGGEEGLKLLKAFVPLKPQKSEVLIVSYDLFRMNSKVLSQSKNIGLLVVDEGHRLKNTSGSLTLSALETLNCKARLLITGTPIQNNLSEFYNVANFAIPGILGDLNTFRRVYERPISVANHKNASMYQKEEGRRVSKELDSITSTFMIRRLQKDILQSLLPPRHEFILFCRPSSVQCEIYKYLTSQSSTLSDPLPLLTKLRKLCTHPLLLKSNIGQCSMGPTLQDTNSMSSGKLNILDTLLQSIRCNSPNDKVVVVSNFTSALTVIENTIIKKREWNSLRLDGTVEQSSRQPLVDSFNRGSVDHSFIFLLSSKAGGCGLNLIGANRLIMVDGDWNPATDLQAMARIYRQGQTKSSFIYRLFTSGTVEEVIYQRQTQKNNLASFSDAKASSKSRQNKSTKFSPEELRDCFTLKENCNCDTKIKIGGGIWKEYYGEDSLRQQNCVDLPLLNVANAKPNNLAYVHIVPQKEGKTEEEHQLEDSDNSYDALMDSASDKEEEFEFE